MSGRSSWGRAWLRPSPGRSGLRQGQEGSGRTARNRREGEDGEAGNVGEGMPVYSEMRQAGRGNPVVVSGRTAIDY